MDFEITTILSYLLIFVAKVFEVSLTTVRNVLIIRGEKGKGSFLAFFEAMVWVVIISTVLSGNILADPVRLVTYCAAFACGNYVGVIIENKLAIGMACIQAVIGFAQTEEVVQAMRAQGFGVTQLRADGKDGPVTILMIFLKRKSQNEAISLIKQICPSALITLNDVRHMRNGYTR